MPGGPPLAPTKVLYVTQVEIFNKQLDKQSHWGMVGTETWELMNLPTERPQAQQKGVKAEPGSPHPGAGMEFVKSGMGMKRKNLHQRARQSRVFKLRVCGQHLL